MKILKIWDIASNLINNKILYYKYSSDQIYFSNLFWNNIKELFVSNIFFHPLTNHLLRADPISEKELEYFSNSQKHHSRSHFIPEPYTLSESRIFLNIFSHLLTNYLHHTYTNMSIFYNSATRYLDGIKHFLQLDQGFVYMNNLLLPNVVPGSHTLHLLPG